MPEERDPHIALTLARIAAAAGGDEDRNKLAGRVLKLLPVLDWSLLDDAEILLTLCFEEIGESVEREISLRKALAESKQGWDPVLQILVRIRRQVKEVRSHGD
jgi:hypothetical protein